MEQWENLGLGLAASLQEKRSAGIAIICRHSQLVVSPVDVSPLSSQRRSHANVLVPHGENWNTPAASQGIIKEIISCRDMDKVAIREDRSLGGGTSSTTKSSRDPKSSRGAAPYEAVALDAMFARSGSGSAGRSDGLERQVKQRPLTMSSMASSWDRHAVDATTHDGRPHADGRAFKIGT
ncbi:hypothetical protein B0T18DRAFT_384966 [Schizothecium vesticola]|uniref:Uncharacterized protein n=1 Tax=Schizothecium vesticola TaxID=314040 RepID=A0AA40F7U5_9PEZI|nr:hypothetical protein B0T18DRAFT_384966 [Schizothecium vesticola]